MGKWDKITLTLPRLLGTEGMPAYQTRINAVKDKIGHTLTGVELVALYKTQREKLARIQLVKSRIDLRLKALEQLLEDSHERGAPGWGDYGATDNTVKLITGEALNISAEPYAQLADPDANREWVIASGLERELRLPWPTLNSHTKELLLHGQPAPNGVKVWRRTKVSLKGLVKLTTLEDLADFNAEDNLEDEMR